MGNVNNGHVRSIAPERIMVRGKPWVTVKLAARELRVNLARAYALVSGVRKDQDYTRQPKLKSMRRGGQLYVSVQSITAYREHRTWWLALHGQKQKETAMR